MCLVKLVKKGEIFLNLDDYISPKQRQEIIRKIRIGCMKYKNYINYLDSDLYEPYTEMRQKHHLTSFILSQFSPNQDSIDGFLLKDKRYGLKNKMVQPELYSDDVILHIYSSSANLKTNIITEYCELYNNNFNRKPIFLIVIFDATKEGDLKSICVKLLNTDLSIKEKLDLFTKSNIRLKVG